MSEAKNVDYLSRLPSELLQDIFDRVQQSDKPIIAPLAKQYITFHQRPLYRQISLDSYNKLDRLCWTAQSNRGIFGYVKRFELGLARNYELAQAGAEVEDLRVLSTEDILSLFRLLDQVETLSIFGSTRLASLILTSEVGSACFPNLNSLTLCSTFANFGDPFNPAHYSILPHYTKLRTFELDVRREAETIKLPSKPLPPVSPTYNSVVRLSIGGPLTSSLDSVHRLISSFKDFGLLNLRDDSPTSQMYELVNSVSEPRLLVYLSLRRSLLGDGSPPQNSIIDAVSKFTSLRCLSVGGNCAPIEPEFYSSLRSLPLGTLAFESGADINLAELAKLITGSGRHETLRTIQFDNVDGQVGTRIEEDMMGVPYVPHEDDEFDPIPGVYPDWELPQWTESFTREGFRKFLILAKKEAIEVRGSAIEALEVEAMYDEEMDRAVALEEEAEEVGSTQDEDNLG